MHDGDHQIRPVHATRLADVVHHLLVFAPGHPRGIVVGLKAARHEFVVAQKSDAQALALDHPRGVCLRQIAPASDRAQARLLEQVQHFGKCFTPKITRVVVGQRHCIEMGLQHRQHAWVRPEREVFIPCTAHRGHHTFQIGHADIGGSKDACKGGKRVTTTGDQRAGRIIQHGVACKHHAHSLACSRGRLGPHRCPDRCAQTHTQHNSQTRFHGASPSKVQL